MWFDNFHKSYENSRWWSNGCSKWYLDSWYDIWRSWSLLFPWTKPRNWRFHSKIWYRLWNIQQYYGIVWSLTSWRKRIWRSNKRYGNTNLLQPNALKVIYSWKNWDHRSIRWRSRDCQAYFVLHWES